MDVILVASWYPAVDDPARGRFVADQAAALLGTGEVRPIVVSFDPLAADAAISARRMDREAPMLVARTAWAAGDLPFSRRGFWSDVDIPVARLPVPDGEALEPGADGDLKRDALGHLAEVVLPEFRNRTGVVHAHTAYPDGYAAAALAAQLKWPLVITEHASFVGRQLRDRGVRRRYLDAVASAQRFIAVSDFLASELRTAIPELANRIEVVPNLVHLEDFAMGQVERRPEELIFVGYRKASKGIGVLLEAFAQVRHTRPNATLRLIGRSSSEAEEQRWHRMAADRGLTGAVAFDPPADRAGVAAALARASLFVHPSPRETFGITILEALASGLPVVATRSGGISPILEDGALGELVAPNDPTALAAAVLRSLDRHTAFDPEHLRAAAAPYSAASVANRLVGIYRELGAPASMPGAVAGNAASEAPSLFGPSRARTRVVAVATGAQTARLLASVPADLAKGVELVQIAWPSGGGGTPAAASSPGRAGRRLRRLSAPFRRAWSRLWARNPVVVSRRGRARDEAMTQVEAVASGAVEVLPLDATSAWILEPLIAAGRVTPLPGGVLWLADEWWSGQAADEPSRARISDATLPPTTGQS